jgi:hypothetical protein
MAAMWRSCGNDRQKDGIARDYPLSRVSRMSRCRREQCALRHDQQFVITGLLPSWRGKLGGTRTCIPRSPAVRRSAMRRGAFGRRLRCGAGRHEQADMITAIASEGLQRPRRSIPLLPSGLFERRCCSNVRPTMRASTLTRRAVPRPWRRRRRSAERVGAAKRRYVRAAMQILHARGSPVISSPRTARQSKIWQRHSAFIVGGYCSKYWRRHCNSLYYRPERATR